MPIALYDATFYDGLGHDPNNTSVHPFAKRFTNENSILKNTFVILVIMVIGASKPPILTSKIADIDNYLIFNSSCSGDFLVVFNGFLLQAEMRGKAHAEATRIKNSLNVDSFQFKNFLLQKPRNKDFVD